MKGSVLRPWGSIFPYVKLLFGAGTSFALLVAHRMSGESPHEIAWLAKAESMTGCTRITSLGRVSHTCLSSPLASGSRQASTTIARRMSAKR